MFKKLIKVAVASVVAFSVSYATPKKYQFFENDYYNHINNPYEKERYNINNKLYFLMIWEII